MTDQELIERLRLQSEHIPVRTLFDDAADRIEKLLELNKELTLQLLAVHGQAADALDKLTEAVEALRATGEVIIFHTDETSWRVWGEDVVGDIRAALAELEEKE